MNKVFKRLKQRIKSDRGDSILTGFLIMSICIAGISGFAIDLSKNMTVRQNMIDISERAAQAGVKTVKSNGSLDWNVVEKIVNEYESQRFPSDVGNGTNEFAFSERGTGCLVNEEYGVLPYYEITLDTNLNGAQNVRSVEGEASDSARTVRFNTVSQAMERLPTLDSSQIYRIVEVKIVDAVPNFMLGWIGIPCMNLNINSSAIAFGENSDLGR